MQIGTNGIDKLDEAVADDIGTAITLNESLPLFLLI